MSNNTATRSGNIDKFQIFQAQNGGESVDMINGVVEIRYYESVLSNTISCTATIVETGYSDSKLSGQTKTTGIIDTLPIRGGEKVEVIFEDAQDSGDVGQANKLSFVGDSSFYINRVRDIDPGTQKDVYYVDMCTREFLANEQTRVVSRYNGKISDSVRKILTDRLKVQKNIETDPTLINYNFIGNDKKPFYVSTWLASKSVPQLSVQGKSSKGGTAGYLFYENYDGFKFKSIDKLFDQQPVKKYIYTNTADKPVGYDDKVLSYKIERDIDLQQNLTLGTYANRSIFFDFYANDYQVRDFNVDDYQKDKIINAGKDDILYVADEFRRPISRLMNHVLDIGVLPTGSNSIEQLKTWTD